MRADTVMLQKILCAGLLVCCVIGCTIEPRENDAEESVVPTPTVPLVPQSDPVVPIVDEPKPDRVFDIFGPKLVESNVDSGRVDPNTDVISLRFNEDIIEIDIKLVDSSDKSMEWIPSIDIITGRRIFLTKIDGRTLGSDRRYYIKGFVEDKNGNKTSIDIEFRAVEDNKDVWFPNLISQSIRDGARNISIDTTVFQFEFNEIIGSTDTRLIIGEIKDGWITTHVDMKWTALKQNKKVFLLKMDDGLKLRSNREYIIMFSATDKSGNRFPNATDFRVIQFKTR